MDKTRLKGKYDFTIKFDPRGGGGSARVVGPQVSASLPLATNEDSGLPDIFRAVQQQLGLTLVKVKAFPLDTIFIDHAETIPTAD